jgi:hypothetical protein
VLRSTEGVARRRRRASQMALSDVVLRLLGLFAGPFCWIWSQHYPNPADIKPRWDRLWI